MRKINSNGYGGRWVAAGLALIALGGMLAAARNLWGIAIPSRLIHASLAIGAVVLLGLGALLVIELSQDRQQNAYHIGRRRTKLPLASGAFECQACGSQQVGRRDAVCPTCGVSFEDIGLR